MSFRSLIAQNVVTTQDVDTMDAEIEEILEKAIEFADGSAYPELSEIFTDIYVE